MSYQKYGNHRCTLQIVWATMLLPKHYGEKLKRYIGELLGQQTALHKACIDNKEQKSLVQSFHMTLPDHVLSVIRRLQKSGYEAYAVGGAVRDNILDRCVGDWDVTTSCLPQDVQKIFPKALATGIQHGTVTIVCKVDGKYDNVEVTTYRSDGTYTDARRPDSVSFGVTLQEDLARRDFTINAMAYDPIAQTLVDPYGGQQDIAQRVVRAVGEPSLRFGEDGLRVLRALRFCAQLNFLMEPCTEKALGGALGSLYQVAPERVLIEIQKLLGAIARSRHSPLVVVIVSMNGVCRAVGKRATGRMR